MISPKVPQKANSGSKGISVFVSSSNLMFEFVTVLVFPYLLGNT